MARINRRKLKESDVEFTIRVVADETTDYEGHFDSGDPEYAEADRAIEAGIRERLKRGDETAWCGVIVEARFEGELGGDSLWGCSLNDTYTAEVVVKEHGMRTEALASLQAAVNERDRRNASKRAAIALARVSDESLKRAKGEWAPVAKAELARRRIQG